MKKLLSLFIALFFIASCGGGGGGGTPFIPASKTSSALAINRANLPADSGLTVNDQGTYQVDKVFVDANNVALKYSSLDESVATVNADTGEITATAGSIGRSTTIQVALADAPDIIIHETEVQVEANVSPKITTNAKVYNNKILSRVATATKTIYIGMPAFLKDNNGKVEVNQNVALTFTSSNPDALSVDNDGVITLKSADNVTISISLRDVPSVILTSLPIVVANVTLEVDSTTASVDMANTTTYQINHTITEGAYTLLYTTNNASVATVDGNGLVSIHSAGVAVITLHVLEQPNIRTTVTIMASNSSPVIPPVLGSNKIVYTDGGIAISENGVVYKFDNDDTPARVYQLGGNFKSIIDVQNLISMNSMKFILTTNNKLYTQTNTINTTAMTTETSFEDITSTINGTIKDIKNSQYDCTPLVITQDNKIYNMLQYVAPTDQTSTSAPTLRVIPTLLGTINGDIKEVVSEGTTFMGGSGSTPFKHFENIYFVTTNGELYCYKNSDHTISKISTISEKVIKIVQRQFGMATGDIQAITENGKIYAWPNDASDSGSTASPTLVANINKPIKAVIDGQLGDIFFITNSNEVYTYIDMNAQTPTFIGNIQGEALGVLYRTTTTLYIYTSSGIYSCNKVLNNTTQAYETTFNQISNYPGIQGTVKQLEFIINMSSTSPTMYLVATSTGLYKLDPEANTSTVVPGISGGIEGIYRTTTTNPTTGYMEFANHVLTSAGELYIVSNDLSVRKLLP